MAVTARLFSLPAGLSGAAGVALSAAAAHAGGSDLGSAATMLLVHAPAFLVLGLLAAPRLTRIGGAVLGAGVLLFAGDLCARHFLGTRLFPMAAPAGGVAMIAGWLIVAARSALSQLELDLELDDLVGLGSAPSVHSCISGQAKIVSQ